MRYMNHTPEFHTHIFTNIRRDGNSYSYACTDMQTKTHSGCSARDPQSKVGIHAHTAQVIKA